MRHEPDIAGVSSKLDVERVQQHGCVTNTDAFGKAEGAGRSRSTDKEDIPIPTMHIRLVMVCVDKARPTDDFSYLGFIGQTNY